MPVSIDTKWFKLVLEYTPTSLYNHTLFDHLKSRSRWCGQGFHKLISDVLFMDAVNGHVVLLVKICGKIYNFKAM